MSETLKLAVSESRPAARWDHGLRRRMVAELLLAEIFQGTLRAGQHLVIKDLSQRYEVSSTPIREALVQLEATGIVDFAPNCGAVVRRLTSSDVRELSQVRRALECEAVRSAVGRIDLMQLGEMAEALRRMLSVKRRNVGVIEKARQLDSRLHDLIVDSCGNRFLAKEVERLKILFRAFRDAAWDERISYNDYRRFDEEAAEHLEIVEALIEGDARRASRAMSRHIRSGVKYWSRGLPR
ncbi:MAG: GntR family transcriptional regulator [Planctomycetaceae bacterium]